MSKKPLNDLKKLVGAESDKNNLKSLKIDENYLLEVVVGSSNVKRWNLLKASFLCESNETFTTKLLDLAQEHLDRNKCKENNGDDNSKKGNKEQTKTKKKKIDAKKDKNEKTGKIADNSPETSAKLPTQFAGSESIKQETYTALESVAAPIPVVAEAPLVDSPQKNVLNLQIKVEKDEKPKKKKPQNSEKPARREKNDIRKAPELDSQVEVKPDKTQENDVKVADVKIKQCQNCGTRHIQDHCPLNYPNYIISDSVTHEECVKKLECIINNGNSLNNDDDENRETLDFSKLSLPNFLQFGESGVESHGAGVLTRNNIEEFTQFGPLIGKVVKEVDIPEDSTMRDLWEICQEGRSIYYSTEDLDSSNWMRYVRPAPTREEKNITVITKENLLYFVSTRLIRNGEELLYWQDFIAANHKKKMEKTSCGGCNMTFSHPLYYRTHCSVFHDLRYSLTIRKYHCKVCGAAVLGKENIMKHAAELHNGQGAYQCQFCKKFFLRLNYLEMHRTYGCSANPHRSRPLCDFCGRKFCQPQKLKVHIKRMHSDFSEVLKEFQCKSCMKILGSRAALQRHLKEVHQKQMDGACSCIKCGKHFQNKSNLKIHMLTHSGIKPFKCVVRSCNAAFTTKQCLQFHYKKVHNFNEEVMPKIERSVDYTFEAYSGLEDGDEKCGKDDRSQQNDSNAATLDEESDVESLDSKTMDDPPMQSPLEQQIENASPEPPETVPLNSPSTDNYNNVNPTMKILSKGSKKWIGDQPLIQTYQIDHGVQEQPYDRPKTNLVNEFGRHEASNASLLVEAALDSVCSEPNIDIDVSSTSNCTDALVNNLYTLAPPDSLPDVTYSESVCINDNRDINLISPSVNDHISVTDELNDELRHQNQNIGMDYSTFHQEDFSPTNSPEIHHRTNFVRNYISNTLSPQTQTYPQKSPNPVPSPPRYDFGHAVNTDHLSSDDSNGMAAQNLSLHSSKQDIQLDLSIYKSPYKMDVPNFPIRKDFRMKSYDDDDEQLEVEQGDDLQGLQEIKDKDDLTNSRKYADDLSSEIRSKFDLDLDIRLKSYDEGDLRTRYESSDLDFRNKTYDMMDKTYEGAIEPGDFRTDRNFEPLVLNSSAELQGLDMSARSFHNYPNINRYHHLYPEVDRVDLRLNYSPPAPSYTHADILRVVSLDLTPPGRHSVDLTLRPHPLHQIHTIQPNHRLLDPRHLSESRLLGDGGRILSDHTTNRLLSNADQLTSHILPNPDDSRIITDQPRLLEQSRLIADGRILPPSTPNGAVSPVPTFGAYSVSQSPYHPAALAPRPHVSSPTPTAYHHYSTYY